MSGAATRRQPARRAPAALARDAIRDTGARVTRQRTQVLAVLLSAARALTHHEVERRIERGAAIDRVTVYRALEWLTQHGLAHKIAGEDRVWRFNAASDGRERAHGHAHFECNGCGEVLCLEEVRVERAVRLPSGYRGEKAELTIKGLCPGCGPGRRHA